MSNNTKNYFEVGFRKNSEEYQIDNLSITGDFPHWLEGTLIRNGPGLVDVDKPMRHWFDGIAMLHRFNISNGKVNYKSRFLDCEAYQTARQDDKISYSDFATDPCRSLFQKVQSIFFSPLKITDSAKVNIDKIGEKAFALGEPLMQIQFDPETLESVGVFHYENNPANRTTTAHPHHYQESSYNLVIQYGPLSFYKIYSLGEEIKEIASIPVLEPSYIHSFGMSENYFIIAEYPLTVQPFKLLLRFKPFIENFIWKKNRSTRFLVIDRKTGKLKTTIKTDSFFSFHHVNAFEIDHQLILDFVAYEDAEIIDQYYLNRLEATNQQLPWGRMERFVLDLKTNKLSERKLLSEACIELPNIDYPRYHGNKNYRYVYGCGINPKVKNEFYNQLVKIDIQTGQYFTWNQEHCYPGEGIFIPKPDRQSEDDGLLLSVVLDGEKHNSFLLILDAKTMEEMARAHLPHPVLFGYHGAFFKNN